MTSSRKAVAINVNAEPQRRLAYFRERLDLMVANIRELVEIESPSDNKAAVDQLGDLVAVKLAALGGSVRFHPASDFGNHLQVDFAGRMPGKAVLLLGHYDTVYPLGTLASMPCRVVNGKLCAQRLAWGTAPSGDRAAGL